MECFRKFAEILEQLIHAIYGPRTQVTSLPDVHVKQLNDSVYEFYCPADGSSPNVEIVFFHGLQSGDYSKAYVETWTTVDGCWPQTWLAEKFPKARILSVSYDSGSRKGQQQGYMDMHNTAETLVYNLTVADGKVAAREGCPLILVGKDLGGLIIKRVCLEAKEDGKTSFLSNLKGIMYYATPHLGVSKLPAKLDGELAQNLGVHDKEIARLNNKFRILRQEHKWEAKALLAAYPGSQPGLDTPEASGRFDVDHCYVAAVDIDNICKPRTIISISFTYLVDLISHALSSESEQRASVTEKGINLKSSLHFGDDEFYVPMRRTINEVRNALQSVHIVVLHGPPGSGKSSLARYLALRFQEASQGQDLGMTSNSNPISPFPDGVVYISCGYGADVMSTQRELLRKLNVPLEEATEYDNIELRQKLREKLAETLKSRKVLVILDDVWESALVQKLVVPGQVKYLLTTQLLTLWKASDTVMVPIQDVGQEDARNILGNYAGFPDGMIPTELMEQADEIIKATAYHPLALATLAIVVSNDRTSVREWLELKDNFLDCLKSEDIGAVVSYGEEYPKTVYAAMTFAVDLLNDTEKTLLQTIALFEGPTIPETIVRLFVRCTQSERSWKTTYLPRKRLESLGLVQKGVLSRFLDLEKQDGMAFVIHGLRQQFVQGTMVEFIDSLTTNFLVEASNSLSLQSDFEFDWKLATILFALYGEKSIKERAIEKMGSRFIWSNLGDLVELTKSFEWLLSVMSMEGKGASKNQPRIARAAAKVFWMLFNEGRLDDDNILCLLDAPETTISACTFLGMLYIMFEDTTHEPRVMAFPQATNKLVGLLLEDVMESIQEAALLALSTLSFPAENKVFLLAVPHVLERLVALLFKEMTLRCARAASTIKRLGLEPSNQTTIGQYPGTLEKLVNLLVEDATESIQTEALGAIVNLAMYSLENQHSLLAIPHALERLVALLLGDKKLMWQGAAWGIAHLALDPSNKVQVGQYPGVLERLFRLLDEDVEEKVQRAAVGALANLSVAVENQVSMLNIPHALGRLVALLLEDKIENWTLAVWTENKIDGCEAAALAISHLAATPANGVHVGQVPTTFERLVGLLHENVRESTQEAALGALANLSLPDENKVTILATPHSLERLLALLLGDAEMRCWLAAVTISNLAVAPSNMVLIGQFSGALERLLDLLAGDVKESIQEAAVLALANLSIAVENMGSMMHIPGALERLVAMLFKDKKTRCEKAALTILHLTMIPSNWVLVGQFPADTLERLVGLLDTDVPDNTQQAAAGALANLCISDENKVTLLAIPHSLEKLVALLFRDKGTSCMFAASAILNLAMAPSNLVPVGQFPGTLEGLVGLLIEDVAESIQEVAVQTLATLCVVAENRVSLLAIPHVLERLVALLFREKEDRCRFAASTISNLAMGPSNLVPVGQFPGTLERLVGLLVEDVTESIQEVAVKTIAILCVAVENRVSLWAIPDALERLVALFVNDRNQRCEAAVLTIYYLALLPPFQVPIGQFPGILKGLTGLLVVDVKEEIQQNAAWALTYLSSAAQNKGSLLAIPYALERLVALLVKERKQTCEAASWTIRHLVMVPSYRAHIGQFPGTLERLVGLLADDVTESIQEISMGTLAILCSADDNRGSLLEIPDALERVVALLSKDKKGCEAAAFTVYHLALVPLKQVTIGQFPGMLQGLVGLLVEDVSECIQGLALQTLAILSSADENKVSLLGIPNVLGRLVALLNRDMKDRCQRAAEIIAKLARTTEDRVLIAQFPGVVERLVGLLVEDVAEGTQKVAVLALANLGVRGVVEGLVMETHVTGFARSNLYRCWSYANVELKDYPAALIDMTKALELDSGNGLLWQERGVIRRLMGDFPGALADLSRALEINPDDYVVLKHRGLVKCTLQDEEGACADAERAMQVGPSQVDGNIYERGRLGMLPVQFLNYTLQ